MFSLVQNAPIAVPRTLLRRQQYFAHYYYHACTVGVKCTSAVLPPMPYPPHSTFLGESCFASFIGSEDQSSNSTSAPYRLGHASSSPKTWDSRRRTFSGWSHALLSANTFKSCNLVKLISSVTALLYRLSKDHGPSSPEAQNHYSQSNAMFATLLGPTRTYSAPLWLLLSDTVSAMDTLGAAQLGELQYTIATARIKAVEHVLEISMG